MLTVDLPGHGSRHTEGLSRGSAVAAVKEVIDAEVGLIGGDSKTMLVGVGLGGYVALAFAAAHTDDVAALLLVDVAVAHVGKGAESAAAGAAEAAAEAVAAGGGLDGALSFVSGGATSRALSYLRWAFGGLNGPQLAPSRLPTALRGAYLRVSEPLLAECFLRPGMALGGWGGALALLHAHEPSRTAPRAGSGSTPGGNIDWRSFGWLEIASAVEKPIMVVNSELAPRTDEAEFMEACCGELVVVTGATRCTLEEGAIDAFNGHLMGVF